MNCEQWSIVFASVISAVATGIIAWYAVGGHKLAESNKKLTAELGRAAQDMDKRNNRTLQHLAAATLAGGVGGGSIPDVTNCFRAYLKRIEEQATKDAEKK